MKYFVSCLIIYLFFSCTLYPDGVRGDKFSSNIPPTVNQSITSKEAGYLINITDVSRSLKDGTPDNTFIPDLAGYNIEALGVNTNWDNELGIIYLSSYEEESEGPGPYATTTITYDINAIGYDPQDKAVYTLAPLVGSIAVSDKLVGTAAELNFRSYDYKALSVSNNVSISIYEVGNNYISGYAEGLEMERKVFKQGIHTHTIKGTINILFTACTRC